MTKPPTHMLRGSVGYWRAKMLAARKPAAPRPARGQHVGGQWAAKSRPRVVITSPEPETSSSAESAIEASAPPPNSRKRKPAVAPVPAVVTTETSDSSDEEPTVVSTSASSGEEAMVVSTETSMSSAEEPARAKAKAPRQPKEATRFQTLTELDEGSKATRDRRVNPKTLQDYKSAIAKLTAWSLERFPSVCFVETKQLILPVNPTEVHPDGHVVTEARFYLMYLQNMIQVHVNDKGKDTKSCLEPITKFRSALKDAHSAQEVIMPMPSSIFSSVIY